eukprot:6442309-Prymnesium_polylepis.2
MATRLPSHVTGPTARRALPRDGPGGRMTTTFAVLYSAYDLWRGQAQGVVRELVSIASAPAHAARLRSLHEALEEAAPLVRYAAPGERCSATPCDAFSALALTVHAVGVSHVEHAHHRT